MGSKCSCISTQQELRSDTDINITSSPTISQNRRFSIADDPLKLSEIFETTTTKYQRIHLIESKEFDNDSDFDNNISYDVDTTIDFLISGYIRKQEQHINDLKLLPIIKKICYQYYNHYLLFNPSSNNNDKTDDIMTNYSLILNKLNEEKLLNLLYNHWKSEWNINLRKYYLPIIHLELIFCGSRDGINDNFKKFHKKCDNKGKTLLIIQSTNDHIFGGFTSIDYTKSTEAIYYDRNAFLFNISTTNKIFDRNKALGYSNIFHHKDNILIHFGRGPDLIIYEKCCNENINQSVSYSFHFTVNQLIGKQHKNGFFTIKEIEVYKVYGI